MTDRPTCIADLMDEKLLRQMIDEGYIRRQQHPTLPLYIYNYSEKAMFEKLWNEATLQCRGLIAHREGWIVARPWEKFFNLGEKATLIGSHDTVEITDKMDGSLGIGFVDAESLTWNVATRGSFTSDQAVWATNWLRETFEDWLPVFGYTPLWEIVYPENRIVLDYGSFEGLVLLGCVDTEMGHVYGPYEAAGLLSWPGETTKVFPERTLAEFMSGPNANRSNAEGVVVRSGHRMVKVKQDDYVRAHAVVTGLSNRSVWEMLANGGGLPQQASFMPDEFYVWIVNTAGQLIEAQAEWKSQVTDYYNDIRSRMVDNPTRKQFAGWAVKQSAGDYSAALFKLFDGQSIDDLAWKAVKPLNFERPFSRSEANS